MPRIADPDPPLAAIVTMDMALGAGLTPDQVRQRVRSGRWFRLARGVYRTRPADASDEWAAARGLHADRAIAEALAHEGCRIGFDSAAVVHGLSLWRSPGPDVSLIARAGGHNGRRPGVVVHRMELHELDVVADPVPITSVPRTWLDVARSGSLVDGLVLGDAALRSGAMTAADVSRVLGTAWARRGMRVAAEAGRHLNGARETPLESASWAYFIHQRLPLPRMQVEIRTAGGRFIARVDFLWDKGRVVGEADGRLKYDAEDALYAEKRREDEIREEGFRVVRWGAVDLRGEALAARLRRFLT
jgi:very-short-patch-repair endonuclease